MRTLGDKITDDYKSLRLGSSAMHLTLYTDYELHCYRCKYRQITHQSCHNVETFIKIQSKNISKEQNNNFLRKINISYCGFPWPWWSCICSALLQYTWEIKEMPFIAKGLCCCSKESLFCTKTPNHIMPTGTVTSWGHSPWNPGRVKGVFPTFVPVTSLLFVKRFAKKPVRSNMSYLA